jgi:uncharacterized protein YqeY
MTKEHLNTIMNCLCLQTIIDNDNNLYDRTDELFGTRYIYKHIDTKIIFKSVSEFRHTQIRNNRIEKDKKDYTYSGIPFIFCPICGKRTNAIINTYYKNLKTMTIQETIKKDLMVAIKSKNVEVTNLLRVVMGEFSTVASRIPNNSDKILTDELALKELRKMSQNAVECGNMNEVNILSKYLPTMLGENQIKIIISNIIKDNNLSGMKDMGKTMGMINKLENSNLIDNKVASKIVKELLN